MFDANIPTSVSDVKSAVYLVATIMGSIILYFAKRGIHKYDCLQDSVEANSDACKLNETQCKDRHTELDKRIILIEARNVWDGRERRKMRRR